VGGLKPTDIVTPASIDNAIVAVLALGGSTNAVVHLVAIARRAGVALNLDRFDALSRETPLIANVRPAGQYLMEDFYYAGGLRAALASIGDLLAARGKDVNGRTLGENIGGAEGVQRRRDSSREKALVANGSLAVLRGNLAPDGAVIKPAAAESRCSGTRVLPSRSPITTTWRRASTIRASGHRDSVLVLKHAGPLGSTRHAGWGQLPIPKKVSATGVATCLRISDARMSGTSYGACVCTWRPNRMPAGRSRSCRMAT
jgi:dihydroxy-acid dehydratase